MKRGRRSGGLFAVAIAAVGVWACNGKVDAGSAAGDGGPPSGSQPGPSSACPELCDAGAPAAPYRLTCTFYDRDESSGVMPPPDFTQHQAIFQSDQLGTQAIDIAPGITSTVNLAAATTPGNVLLTVNLPASGLTNAYELPIVAVPSDQLVGGEGFSGLNYIVTPGSSLNLQFICEASPAGEARPKPITPPTGSDPAAGHPPGVSEMVPIRIRCDVSGSDGVASHTDSITLTDTTKKDFVIGPGAAAHVDWVNGPPPVDPGSGIERTLVLQLSHDPAALGVGGWTQQIAFQLDPSAKFTNPLRGAAAMTGTATLHGIAPSDGGTSDAGPDGGASITIGCTAE